MDQFLARISGLSNDLCSEDLAPFMEDEGAWSKQRLKEDDRCQSKSAGLMSKRTDETS